MARLVVHEGNAIVFDAEGSGEYERASALLDAALRNATPAEVKAAHAIAEEYREAESAEYRRTGDSSALSLSLDDIRIPYERPARSKPADPALSASPAVSASPASVSTEGTTTMANVEELRAALSLANSRAEGVQGLLAQAAQELREITGTVETVAQGSGRAEIHDAAGMLAQIAEQTEQLLGMTSAARTAIEAYAGYL
ncbi:hypothetical protein ACXIZN_30300 [Amycolatopsis sp. TRM77291]